MMTRSFEDKLGEVRVTAIELGKRLEESLIGDRHPSAERVKDVYELLEATKASSLSATFGDDKTLERLAAEGVMSAIISESNLRVIKWRIEARAESCACALMKAKRVDVEGVARRDKVYEEAYATIRAFVTLLIPEDFDLGYSFARPIMDKADAEVKAAMAANKPVEVVKPPVDKSKKARDEARKMAEELGKRLEDSLIGDPNVSEKRVKEVYDTLVATRVERLNKIFGKERTMEKIAAEGVVTAIIHNSHTYVLKNRIEMKAKSCASALMKAKRVDHEGIKLRGKVYDDAYGAYHSFVKRIMPEDPELGVSYGRGIMDKADQEVKAHWKVTKTG